MIYCMKHQESNDVFMIWNELVPLPLSFIPYCTYGIPLVQLLVSFLPLVFHQFLHAAL